ncbi:hypothetical protein [Clostridium sp. DJ247]|nr:hypothetical protein [Clostridium sp. DJ247]
MVKKKIEVLGEEKFTKQTGKKFEHRRVNKEIPGTSGKYSAR